MIAMRKSARRRSLRTRAPMTSRVLRCRLCLRTTEGRPKSNDLSRGGAPCRKARGVFRIGRPTESCENADTQTGRDLRCIGMLLTIAVILVALWLLGFVAHVAGGLI